MVRTGFCCPGRLFPEGRGNRFEKPRDFPFRKAAGYDIIIQLGGARKRIATLE
jgi:hypothetical protein